MILASANESGGFAIAMIAVMGCAFGVIGLIIFTIFRNASKRSNEIDELLEEASKPKKKPTAIGEADKKPEAWERDGDWWKK